ncbi:MAG: hypothetical protein JO249_22965 [Acidobacteria bacterium]|nr:hypothetical protein [Acidobacteriota bacterium]
MQYVFVLLVISLSSFGQALPEAASHSFFDRANDIRMSLFAGLVAADGITTQHILGVDHGAEMNPIVRPLVVRGARGQAAASVLGSGLSLGTSYLFHRTGHHKLERLMLNTSIAVETECVTNNLVQIGKAGR